jgi:diguanylate cyclase (GGDEF)-like protein
MLGGTLRGLRTAPVRLVLFGVAAQAVGFSLWSKALLQGTYVPGDSTLDPLWVIGLSAMGIGGMLAWRRPEEESIPEEPSYTGAMLPGLTFLILFVAVLVTRFSHSVAAVTSEGLRIALLCSGTALIARSSVLGRRLQQLLNRERDARRSLAERESELARLNEQLVEDSRRDPLTGIGNRRALSDDMPMYQSLQHESARIAVALCDVDHFKSYNDRLGHLAGDQALRMVAAHVRGAMRAVDTAYRFGGEELLLVLRDVDAREAAQIGERVRQAVSRAAFPHPEGEGGVLTVSVGIACGEGDMGSLLARADAALYEAKRLGRNRVVSDSDGQAAASGSRQRDPQEDVDGPVPRHLRTMLSVSRAAASRRGVMPVLDALAEAIIGELSFGVVAVNLVEPAGDCLRVVAVEGDAEARATLLDTTHPLSEWQRMLAAGERIHGAVWLAAGTYPEHPDQAVWTPSMVPAVGADSWQPEDMLMLPLRSASGELLGVVSVDQPRLGRRPSHDEIGVLMAVADHAALALDQVRHEDAVAHSGSEELRLAAVMLLAETLDLRDPSTALHSRTVGQLARMTALALRLDEDRVERIHAAGVLHDLGKLGIADAILQKPGALDDTEWREIRRHPEVGARILEHAGMRDIAAWVRSHHERIDGGGYPDALAGAGIPLEARILAVCDAYEAMIADRPYRRGMPITDARAELLRCSGTQFDPDVVSAFLDALDAHGPAVPEALVA